MESAKPVRIATIAGRFLVFDPDAVAVLRRRANTNGTLVGTAPQQPTQNIFLGLPIELRPEEVEALVLRDQAYVVDDAAAHYEALRSCDPEPRKAYIESLRKRKQAAHKVYVEMMNAKRTSQAANRGAPSGGFSSEDTATAFPLLSSSSPPSSSNSSSPQAKTSVNSLAVTPTCANDLVSPDACTVPKAEVTEAGSLCRFLQGAGYYMTPGLRFGAKYSVYPGDPLRFHAHFMANQYGWEEEIPILDLVGGGRLATAVKKAFLVGGEEPCSDVSRKPTVRTFSIEWAGM